MSETVDRLAIGEGRRLLRGLRDLADVQAPAGLLGAVLAGTGLADAYWEMDSPIGRIYVAYSGLGISAVTQAKDASAFERTFAAHTGRPIHRVARPPAVLARRVAGELQGRKTRLGYDLRALNEFQRAVLLKALEIPRGEVRSYSWIAREINRPGAVRAVGTALATNPIPLLIPCHRVVRRDGRIGDYAFGSDAKRAMLRFEGLVPETLEELATSGVRFVGSDTTGIFCFPTCRHARRVTEPHKMRFPSLAAAEGAGYRACLVCRPA